MVTGYIGFDPSADSLHVGNLVAIMGLAWLSAPRTPPDRNRGGGTGRIGDPSGKSAERNLLSEEQILHNVSCIANQLRHFLNFDSGENSALLVNNNDWLKNENYIEFLRDTGKYFTVSFLVNREYVRSRVLDPDKSITYTELSYILAPGLRLQPPLQRIRMHAPDGRQRPAGQHHRRHGPHAQKIRADSATASPSRCSSTRRDRNSANPKAAPSTSRPSAPASTSSTSSGSTSTTRTLKSSSSFSPSASSTR